MNSGSKGPPEARGGAKTGLQIVYAEVEKLEAERQDLDRRIEARGEENGRLGERLAILSRPLGDGKPWRWYHSLLLAMASAGAIWAVSWYQLNQKRAYRARMAKFHRLPKTSHPYLLVTTQPTGARVSVNGKALGVAPILHPFAEGEAKRHLMVEVIAPGLKPRREEVTIGAHRGAHLHVELVRR